MNRSIPAILVIAAVLILVGFIILNDSEKESVDESHFPDLYIDTNGVGINDKENYVPCTISIKDSDQELGDSSAGIKGRGNSTWLDPKKPYNIKFDSKTDVLGMGKAKKWCLIANYCDLSLVRNYLAYDIARNIGCDFTMDCRLVNLYINEEYIGLYLLTEKVEIGKTRVDIDDTIEQDVFDFLVEMDGNAPNEGIEGVDWFYVGDEEISIPFGMKDPDCTPEQMVYAKNIVQNAWNVIHNDPWKDVIECIDVDSFAASYIVEELFHEVDVNWSSFYMYCKDGKLYSGPIWDFDRSAGNRTFDYDPSITDPPYYYGPKSMDPTQLYAENGKWYVPLLRHHEFKEIISQKLSSLEEDFDTYLNTTYKDLISHQTDFEDNFRLWPMEDILPFYSNSYYETDWKSELEYVMDWLSKSLDNMKRTYSLQDSKL